MANDDNKELEPYDYFKGKKPKKTYTSKSIPSKQPDGTIRNIRIVSKVVDSPETWTHAKLEDEIVLRVTPGSRQQIVAKLYEDTRGVFVLSIQRFTTETGAPHEASFAFIGEEILTLKNFIDSLKFLDFSSSSKGRIEDEELEKARAVFMSNRDFLIEMAEKNITKRDVVTLAYRKEQLEIFKRLLSEETFFTKKKGEWEKTKDEDVWQRFFEENPWIFGYGLNLIFNAPLEGKKLEQTVKGYDIDSYGKRVDSLLKTKGIVSSICLVEVKTHKTPLLKELKNPYRKDCWALSDEFNGGVVQIQKTSQKTIENLGTRFEPKISSGAPTGEKIYLYKPKSYLIVGNLSEFETSHGLNNEKYSSFELFRRSLIDPEIITFDELYERAKFIVQNNEEASKYEFDDK